MAKVFTDLSAGLSKIGDIVTDSEKGVQISHTLENLALITAGVSARTSANGINAISKAIEKSVGCPAFIISTSPDRDDIIEVQNPFER